MCDCTHNLNHKSLKTQIGTHSAGTIFPGTLPNNLLQSAEFHKAKLAGLFRNVALPPPLASTEPAEQGE